MSKSIELTGDECVMLAGTVALMRTFARMMVKYAAGEVIPDELLKLTALSMVSQIECDFGLHPDTRRVVDDFEGKWG